MSTSLSWYLWSQLCWGALEENTKNAIETPGAKTIKNKPGIDLCQYFMKVWWRTTTASCCRLSNQSHVTVRPPLSPNLQRGFPPPRQGVKCKMLNRYNTGGDHGLWANTRSNSILRKHHPCLWFLSACRTILPSTLSPHSQGQMLGQSILSTHHLVEEDREERTNGIPLVYQV